MSNDDNLDSGDLLITDEGTYVDDAYEQDNDITLASLGLGPEHLIIHAPPPRLVDPEIARIEATFARSSRMMENYQCNSCNWSGELFVYRSKDGQAWDKKGSMYEHSLCPNCQSSNLTYSLGLSSKMQADLSGPCLHGSWHLPQNIKGKAIPAPKGRKW